MTESTACDCKKCRAECKRVPGWFAPAEARAAIEAGLAGRLTAVRQFYQGVGKYVTAIAPARCGEEGRPSDYGPGRCTFLKNDGLCEIHGQPFKPIECVTGFACKPAAPGAELEKMIRIWASEEGRAVVRLWRTVTARVA